MMTAGQKKNMGRVRMILRTIWKKCLLLLSETGGKAGEMGMTKSEVKNALDEIRDMSDEEIADNGQYIRKVAEEAFALIKNLERR